MTYKVSHLDHHPDQGKKESGRMPPLLQWIITHYPHKVKIFSSGQMLTRCIFHDDDHPSLYISTVNNCYHCFGCNAHGSLQKLAKEMKEMLTQRDTQTDRLVSSTPPPNISRNMPTNPDTIGVPSRLSEAFKSRIASQLREIDPERADKIENCSVLFRAFRCEDCGEYDPHPLRCKDRLCPECAPLMFHATLQHHRAELIGMELPAVLTVAVAVGKSDDLLDDELRLAAIYRKISVLMRELRRQAGVSGGLRSVCYFEVDDVYEVRISVLFDGYGVYRSVVVGVVHGVFGDWVEVDVRYWPLLDGALRFFKEINRYEVAAQTVYGLRLLSSFVRGRKRIVGFGCLYRVSGGASFKGSGDKKCPVCGSSKMRLVLGLFGREQIYYDRFSNRYKFLDPPSETSS